MLYFLRIFDSLYYRIPEVLQIAPKGNEGIDMLRIAEYPIVPQQLREDVGFSQFPTLCQALWQEIAVRPPADLQHQLIGILQVTDPLRIDLPQLLAVIHHRQVVDSAVPLQLIPPHDRQSTHNPLPAPQIRRI